MNDFGARIRVAIWFASHFLGLEPFHSDNRRADISQDSDTSPRPYLKADVESCAWIYILEVAVLLAGIDVHLVVHRHRGQILVGEAAADVGSSEQQKRAK